MTIAQIPTPLAGARAKLDELRTEAAQLEADTLVAQRAHDVDRWLTLLNRADSLPAEIAAAELEVLHLDAAEAWATVEVALTTENAAAEAAASAAADLKRFRSETVVPPAEERIRHAEYLVAHDAVVATAREAEAAHEAAQDATGQALYAAELLDQAMLDQDLELLDCNRPTLRVLEASAVILLPDHFGSLASVIDTMVEELQRHDEGNHVTITAGTIVPRWIAHRLGDQVFEKPTTDLACRVDEDHFSVTGEMAAEPSSIWSRVDRKLGHAHATARADAEYRDSRREISAP